ncbi:MAG: TIGR04282 family arsenosugar biosynthesis glycosyltransferase [Acetobacteraceae bacterium]
MVDRTAIAVMAKAPQQGAVKTRLTPPLQPAEAALLSESFLIDITATLHAAARTAPITPFLAYAPRGAEARLEAIIAAGTRLVLADGGSVAEPGVCGIGRGLLQAARRLVAQGYGAVSLVSADAPTLPATILAEAAHALARPGERMVLGPAADGGYYLIGLKAPHRRLFQDIAWSSETVAAETVSRAREIGLEVVLLPTWYDVDDEATLGRLRQALARGAEQAPATKAALARLGLIEGAVE